MAWDIPGTREFAVPQSIRDKLYEVASNQSVFDQFFPEKPMTRRERWKLHAWYWWRTHRPVFHFGDCDHDDCD